MTDEDRIKCMFANQDQPELFVCSTSVIDELDEIFELRYGYAEDDPWPRQTILERIISLDSRVFQASLQLPYWGSMRTEYTLFALLKDMQYRGRRFTTSVFKWRDIFNSPSYAALGGKIRSLWDATALHQWEPTQEEQRLINSQHIARPWSSYEVQSREDSFIEMRENLAHLLAKVLMGCNNVASMGISEHGL